MTWDLRLDPMTRDLTAGLHTDENEILQRLVTRLHRELGEWFLDTESGLPWYQGGEGLLGSKNKTVLDLLIRKETRETEGVERILKFNTIYQERQYSIYMLLLLSNGDTVPFRLESGPAEGAEVECVELYKRTADTIYFETGETLQDLYDSGKLAGEPGTPATVTVVDTLTGAAGTPALVENMSADASSAELRFTIPQGYIGETGATGATGKDGAAATVTVGNTTTGPAGGPASVTNVGDATTAILEFVIPKGDPGAFPAMSDSTTSDRSDVAASSLAVKTAVAEGAASAVAQLAALGFAADAPSLSDLDANNWMTGGVYYHLANAANMPYTNGGFIWVIKQRGGNGIKQIAFRAISTNAPQGQMYVRTGVGQTDTQWSNWMLMNLA